METIAILCMRRMGLSDFRLCYEIFTQCGETAGTNKISWFSSPTATFICYPLPESPSVDRETFNSDLLQKGQGHCRASNKKEFILYLASGCYNIFCALLFLKRGTDTPCHMAISVHTVLSLTRGHLNPLCPLGANVNMHLTPVKWSQQCVLTAH